jgi:hypothetical protein
MTETQKTLWMQEKLAQLATLRDEIRVDLHLAGMDARDGWARLEPRVLEAERLVEDVSDISRHALNDVVERVREFRELMARRPRV